MATWVTHLMVADEVIKQVPFLCRHDFFVGNIALDCNVGNERKTAADCDKFLHEYVEKKENLDIREESFLLGYYAHLITDAEHQRFIRDENRVKACWDRIKQHLELSKLAVGMEETWNVRKKCNKRGKYMVVDEKKIILSNGRIFVLRSPRIDDAVQMIEYLKTSAGETDFLLRYPEEVNITVE